MKWSLLGVVVLGIVAAACAAVLVVAVRAEGRVAPTASTDPSADVTIVVAATDMSALVVVDAKSVLTKTVPKDEAPAQYVSNPVSVVGKVLARGMVAGQPFTANCFASEGTGLQLASALPKGMRAVTISLPGHSSLTGLLYPGSVVDVLASFKLSSRQDELGQAVSIVLLQGVQVLAVQDRTIVSEDDEKEAAPKSPGSYGRKINVTLLVTPRQAEALQLAVSNGNLSLAMRNPLDLAPTDRRATVLSELSDEFLSRLAETIQPSPGSPDKRTPAAPGESHPGAGPPVSVAAAGSPPAVPTAPRAPILVDPPARQTEPPAAQWQMVVIRAGHREKHSFPLPRAQQER